MAHLEDILSLVPTDVLGVREDELNKLLNEVRAEIEENEMVHGIPLKVPRFVHDSLRTTVTSDLPLGYNLYRCLLPTRDETSTVILV